jgi:glycosyltransferase involved in cell wall biosynthesis
MIIAAPELVKAPMVSVIVCAFNREVMISQTIDSILQQKCSFPFELIIGEDCGTDLTRNICIDYQKKHPSIIKLILHDTNKGAGGNWAISMKAARGKYIASCDDDDYWHNPAKLQLQVDYLEDNPDYGMVHTEIDVLDEKKRSVVKDFYKSNKISIHEGFIMQKIFREEERILLSSSLLRKELADKYIPYNDYISLRFTVQDWPTWIIISKYSKIGYIPVSTTTYRTGHYAISNLTSYEKTTRKLNADHIMYKYLCDMFPDDLIYNENGYLIYINEYLLNMAYGKNDFGSAQLYSKRLAALGFASKWVRGAGNPAYFRFLVVMKKVKHHLFGVGDK